MELLLQMSVIDAVRDFQCDFGVLLMDESEEGLSIVAFSGIEQELVETALIPTGKSLSGSVAKARKPVIVDATPERLSSYEGMVEGYYSGSVACVPMFSGEQFIGLINLCRKDCSKPFVPEDLIDIFAYASQVSSSIQGQMIIDVRILELERSRDELADHNEQMRGEIEERIRNEASMEKQQSILHKKIEALQHANKELETTNKELLRTNAKALEGGESFEDRMSTMDKGAVLVQEGTIKRANPAFESISGRPVSELEGSPLSALFSASDSGSISQAIDSCGDSDVKVLEDMVRIVLPSGESGNLRVSVSGMEYEGSTACFIFFSDATDHKEAEDRYMQVSKLESVGQLAAGIAHEINTPTQFVGDNTRFIEEAFEEISVILEKYEELVEAIESGGDTAAKIEEIKETAENADLEFLTEEVPRAISQSLDGMERVAKIVRSMKEFSHPGSEDMAPTDINKIIENTITVAKNEYKYVADLETDYEEGLDPVPCVSGQISQVILNMVINASHAIGALIEEGRMRKGSITIKTQRDGSHALIEISDNGSGIPEEVKQKIFDPFFTTKGVGKGTGQGLAISRSVVVDKHHGEIECDTEQGKGTKFSIRLPYETDGGGTQV